MFVVYIIKTYHGNRKNMIVMGANTRR